MVKTHNIKFSIIMPCYNSAGYVNNAIQSVINQTYKNWEYIIVNDGSTDKTLSILNEYANKDDRIRIFSKENGGYCSAINMGLDNITGDYFLMMGSDDALDTGLFEKLAEEVENINPDIVAFRAIKCDSNGIIGVDEDSDFKSRIYFKNDTPNIFLEKYTKELGFFANRDTAKLYKTTCLGDLRYFGKYGIDSDGAFSSLFSHNVFSYLILPIDGYYWTIRRDSLSSVELNLEKKYDIIKVWYLYFCWIVKENYNSQNYIDNLFLDLLYTKIKNVSQKYIIRRFILRKKVLKLLKVMYARNNRKTDKSFRLLVKFPISFSLILKINSKKS